MPNMNLIHLKTKELLRYYCSFNGNLVAVAMDYAADPYCPKRKLNAKYELYAI